MTKLILSTFLLCAFTSTSFATGWMTKTVPTSTKSVRTLGFAIWDSFGNPGTACGRADAMLIANTHPENEILWSMAMSALMAEKELKGHHNVTNEGGQALLALTISAFQPGKQVNVNYYDDAAYCYSRQPTISD